MTPKRRSHSAEVVDLTGHDADGLLTQDGSAAPTQRNKRQRKPKAESVNAVNPTSAHQVSAPQEGTSASALATPRRRRSSQGQQPQERRTDEYGAEVRFRATPTKDITDRIARAMPGSGHRMFLISTTQVRPAGDPQGAEQAYAVLGATGNGACAVCAVLLCDERVVLHADVHPLPPDLLQACICVPAPAL